MRIAELLEFIEQIANPLLQADWDNSGMQIICDKTEVNSVAVFLDPTPQQIAKALALGADFLLSHHPLTLKPRFLDQLNNYSCVVRHVIKANAILYAAHTSLDVNLAGPAGWLARELDLQGCEPLETLPQLPDDNRLGYGFVGNLPNAASAAELVRKVKKMLGLDFCLATGAPLPNTCRRIAFCGGSGASLIKNAEDLHADIYFTGDVKYHSALEAGIPVMDIGHHGMEEEMMNRFAKQLQDNFPDLKVIFISSNSPFKLIA